MRAKIVFASMTGNDIQMANNDELHSSSSDTQTSTQATRRQMVAPATPVPETPPDSIMSGIEEDEEEEGPSWKRKVLSSTPLLVDLIKDGVVEIIGNGTLEKPFELADED